MTIPVLQKERMKITNWAEFIVVVLGGIVTFLLLFAIAPLTAFWDAWWATKVWNQFVVPRTGWRPLSWGIIALLTITWDCIRPRETPKKGEPETRYRTWILMMIVAAPLSYGVAWFLCRWFI